MNANVVDYDLPIKHAPEVVITKFERRRTFSHDAFGALTVAQTAWRFWAEFAPQHLYT